MTVAYKFSRGLARVCFSTFGRWEVEGREAVPPRGRLLVVANHQSNADPPVVAAALPRQASFVGKSTLFHNPVASAVLKSWGVHPLDRNSRDAQGPLWIIHTLEREQAVAIFPEGTRSPRGLRKASHGAAYMALKTHTPILPVGIIGTENVTAMWRILFPFCRIRVVIGQPFSLPSIEGKPSDAVLDSLTEMIMLRIAALLPEEYRGVYSQTRSQAGT